MKISCVVFVVVCLPIITALINRGNEYSSNRSGKSKGRSDLKLKYGSECRSDVLTCVAKEDCELPCPYGFQKLESGGACYFISKMESNPLKTMAEAEDYCEDIDAKLLWIEDSVELKLLIDLHLKEVKDSENTTTPGTDTTTIQPDTDTTTVQPDTDTTTVDTDTTTVQPATDATTDLPITDGTVSPSPVSDKYFIAAEYDKHEGSWVWKHNKDKIDWHIILSHTLNIVESLRAINNANINKCLTLNLPRASPSPVTGTLVEESECISSNGYICKLGEARARCAKSSQTTCCYSPSYDFYVQNTEYLRAGNCQMRINGTLMDCEEVISTIRAKRNESNNMYSIARVGSSYYYIASNESQCIGRDAIIQNEEVHFFIKSLLATKELFYQNLNIRIGLSFRLEDQMAYWVNGKPEDYYKQFWYPGEPKRDDSVDGGCAAYSNVPRTSTYLWRLFSKEMCLTFSKICELPIFQTPTTKKDNESCGKRQERGVLAKSLYPTYSTDEANFGEFPWQAAVMYSEKYGREVKRKFACSGALIHKSFVLTSAHCVTSINVQKDFIVVLGQHDLRKDDSILEPLVLDVKEIILHHEYNSRQSYLDDLALLQLDGEVDVNSHPHIGIGCLPDPYDIRSHNGEWDCFITGWSTEGSGYNSKYGSLVLKRVESDFTSEEYCHHINREYYQSLAYRRRKPYSNRHDDPHNYYRSETSELLCADSAYGGCLEDSSPILICKKESLYAKKPFFGSRKPASNFKKTLDQSAYKASKPKNYEIKEKISSKVSTSKFNDYIDDEYIVNSYGEDRFDSETWYVIGIGNTLSECLNRYSSKYDLYGKNKYQPNYNNFNRQNQRYVNKGGKTQVFTSVYDYINLIHYIIDLHQ